MRNYGDLIPNAQRSARMTTTASVPVELRRPRAARSRPEAVLTQVREIVPTDLTSEVTMVTPEMARLLRDTAHFERQRKIASSNVDRLAHEMRSGFFTPGTQIYICVLPDGSQHIVNGNHTLESVAASGVSQRLTITRHHVATIDDAGRIYAVFDTQRVRSWADSRKAAGVGDDMPMVDKVLSALKVIERRFANNFHLTMSRTDTLGHLAEYDGAARLIHEAIAGAPSRTANFVKRAGVLAVALETAKYQPSLAQDFWGAVAHDDGLTKGMPEKSLVNCLGGTTASAGGGTQVLNAKAAALAWNAKFRGDASDMVKPRAMSSFYLLGTPWHKGTGADEE